jgi:hypothetical protein
MRKLLISFVLIFCILNLISQEGSKNYIEIISEFLQINGFIENIVKEESNTKLVIKTQNKIYQVSFKNSKTNEIFLSYIKIGDMINLKVVENEKRIAIFKKQDNSIKVKIFYIKQ